jgi:hypothetical protein
VAEPLYERPGSHPAAAIPFKEDVTESNGASGESAPEVRIVTQVRRPRHFFRELFFPLSPQGRAWERAVRDRHRSMRVVVGTYHRVRRVRPRRPGVRSARRSSATRGDPDDPPDADGSTGAFV